MSDIREDVLSLVREAPAEVLPELLGDIEAARALAWARLNSVQPSAPAVSPEDDRDRLLDMPTVAARLGITEHQAREMGRRAELPVITVGERHVRVRAGALRDWIAARERGGRQRG